MPNIALVLREEIQRLAKKEIRPQVKQLRKDNVRLKRDVADLKRRLTLVESEVNRMVPQLASLRRNVIDPRGEEVKKARIGQKSIASLRKRLKLSRQEFASLVGVSANSVYLWERGEISPRAEARAALLQLRGIGVREARKRLAEME